MDGKAKDVVIKEGIVGFGCARAAIQALNASQFFPAKRGDEIVPFRIAIPYQFKLEDEVTRREPSTNAREPQVTANVH